MTLFWFVFPFLVIILLIIWYLKKKLESYNDWYKKHGLD